MMKQLFNVFSVYLCYTTAINLCPIILLGKKSYWSWFLKWKQHFIITVAFTIDYYYEMTEMYDISQLHTYHKITWMKISHSTYPINTTHSNWVVNVKCDEKLLNCKLSTHLHVLSCYLCKRNPKWWRWCQWVWINRQMQIKFSSIFLLELLSALLMSMPEEMLYMIVLQWLKHKSSRRKRLEL